MSRVTTLRNTVKVTAPFLYAASFVLVMLGDVAVISFVERTIGFWNDRPGLQPADLITLRYVCTALYVILATLVILLLATYENQAAHGVSLGYGVAMVLFFTIGYAILIDVLVLWWQRRKYVQVSSEDSA